MGISVNLVQSVHQFCLFESLDVQGSAADAKGDVEERGIRASHQVVVYAHLEFLIGGKSVSEVDEVEDLAEGVESRSVKVDMLDGELFGVWIGLFLLSFTFTFTGGLFIFLFVLFLLFSFAFCPFLFFLFTFVFALIFIFFFNNKLGKFLKFLHTSLKESPKPHCNRLRNFCSSQLLLYDLISPEFLERIFNESQQFVIFELLGVPFGHLFTLHKILRSFQIVLCRFTLEIIRRIESYSESDSLLLFVVHSCR